MPGLCRQSGSGILPLMEGLRVADASLIVYIHPSKANKIEQAILRQLSSLLFQFDEAYEGVVLAYSVNVQDKSAKILPGVVPYFGVRVKSKLLLFYPKPDMVLEGKVVKLGKEFVHVIVLGFASAAISAEDIREEFKYKIKNGEGVFSSRFHKRHVIKVGTMLRFLVKSFDEEVLHISGSLIPTSTGCVRYLYKHVTEDASLHEHTTEGTPLRKHTAEKVSKKKFVQENSHLRDASGIDLFSKNVQEASQMDRNSKKRKDKSEHFDTHGGALGEISSGQYSSKLERLHKSKRKRTVGL